MPVDPRARFEDIYEAYSGLILAYAARRTEGPADAADVVAETFLVAWRRMSDVPDGESARPWLYGVARRVLANQRRGRARRVRLDDRLAAALRADVAVTTGPDDGRPCGEAVRTALAALGEDDRELLTLLAWDGVSREELAAILGCSRATCRVRLHRARRRFAEHLHAAGLQRTAGTGHGSPRRATARLDPREP